MIASTPFPGNAAHASVPPGHRLYVIGDVHGRLDLLEDLVRRIRDDNDRRPTAEVRLILLGDLIDRGPDSAAVVTYCRNIARHSRRCIILKGNHEAAMVLALRGNRRMLAAWLRMGGDITLQSWGVDVRSIHDGASRKLLAEARKAVTDDVLDWMDARPLSLQIGGYLFVHAGIRPHVALADQQEEDLLWIGDPFLESADDHGVIVVHGHTIDPDGPIFRHNRIGIDTGAYHTDRLTALVLERSSVGVLTTGTPG